MDEFHRSFLAEAERLGIKEWSLTHRRKSLQFTGTIAGQRLVCFLPCTPSDSRRGADNAIAHLRSLVQRATQHLHPGAATVERALPRVIKRRPRPALPTPRPLIRPTPSSTHLSSDPFAVLETLRRVLSASASVDGTPHPSTTARRNT